MKEGSCARSPLHLPQPVAKHNSDPQACDGKRKCQAHVAPELERSVVRMAKDVAHAGRLRLSKIRVVVSGEEPVVRGRRIQEGGKRPLNSDKDRQKNNASE